MRRIWIGIVLLGAVAAAPARVWLNAGAQVSPAGQKVANPGLETAADGLATGWEGWDDGGYQVDDQVHHSGQRSARCTVADPKRQYGVGQSVTLNQARPTPILARVWSRAQDVGGSPDTNYSLYLDLEYMDGTPLWGQISSFDVGTHDWQQVRVLVMPAKPVKSVHVLGLFRSHSGTAWFDDFELYELSDLVQFDLQPVQGEIPAAQPRWRKLPFGGQSLLVDPATGAMSLDGTRLGGLVLHDARGDEPFLLPELKVTEAGGGFDLQGGEAGLEVTAHLRPAGTALRLDGEVRDTTGRDRAVSVYWALPVPGDDWTWCEDPRRSSPAADRPLNAVLTPVGAGANTQASKYPFVALAHSAGGLALGAPITVPRLARFAYQPQQHLLFAAFDLGLSPATEKHPSSATFAGLLYGFDPAWRFRAALQRYYELNAEAFTVRVKQQGLWMPFQDISTVQGWEDFGFQFQEGAPNPSWDDAHGIDSFPYIEPMSYWMAMDPALPREVPVALKQLQALGAKGDQRALATRSSGLFGPDGQYSISFQDTPWCNGALFLNNPDPTVKPLPDAPITQYQIHEQTMQSILGGKAKAAATAWSSYAGGFELVAGQGRGGGHAARCTRTDVAQKMGLQQTITLSQDKPRAFIATGWSKAQGVTGEPDNNYCLYLDLNFTDGDHLWGQVSPFRTGTHDWEQATVRVDPPKPVATVAFYALFREGHTGTVWFDDLSLKETGSAKELVRDGTFETSSQPARIDGLYLDSYEMGASALNYRRDHFATSELPLTFDRAGRVCELGHFMVMAMSQEFAKRLHDSGRLIFANAVFWQYPWPASHLDVFGTEIDWNRGGYHPTSDEQMLFFRAMSGQRPYLFLQNTNFDKFPSTLVEKYFARSCVYGILPSFFSENAATGVYWTRPDLYNRDRPLFKRYIPVIRRLAEAGWQPVTLARSSDPDIWVERFGTGREVYLALFNGGTAAKTAEVTADLKELVGGPATVSRLLPTPADLGPAAGAWKWSCTLEPDTVAVLRVARR